MEQDIKSDKIEHIYVHIPFCQKKCPYCSFYSVKFDHSLLEIYHQALIKEISLLKDRYDLTCKTLYFGGGTPSLLPVEKLDQIITELDFDYEAEITLEVNPYNIDIKQVEKWAEKINRVSIGAQSFLEHELRFLGRLHSVADIYGTIEIMRSVGINNISLDLIYGLPNQTREDVRYSLNEICKLNPSHVSAYCLSLEPVSEMYSFNHRLPPDDVVADFYDEIRQSLFAKGYQQYEISNFSKAGYESKHNLAYWKYKTFAGLGASSHSRIFGYAYNNTANIDRYVEMMKKGNIMANKRNLTIEEREKEYIIMNLRTEAGLNLKEFRAKFSSDFGEKYAKKLEKYQKHGLLTETENNIRLTPKAYFISDSILADFV